MLDKLTMAGFVTAASLALASSAAALTTVNVGDEIGEFAALASGGTIELEFVAGEDLIIESFAFSGTGFANGSDLAGTTFGINSTTGGVFETISTGPVSAATGFLPGASFSAGESFSIFFDDTDPDNNGTVLLTLSFEAIEPVTTVAPIPLPAAGGMLLGALALGAGIARRKSQKA